MGKKRVNFFICYGSWRGKAAIFIIYPRFSSWRQVTPRGKASSCTRSISSSTCRPIELPLAGSSGKKIVYFNRKLAVDDVCYSVHTTAVLISFTLASGLLPTCPKLDSTPFSQGPANSSPTWRPHNSAVHVFRHGVTGGTQRNHSSQNKFRYKISTVPPPTLPKTIILTRGLQPVLADPVHLGPDPDPIL